MFRLIGLAIGPTWRLLFLAKILTHRMTEKGLKVGHSMLDFYNNVTEISVS